MTTKSSAAEITNLAIHHLREDALASGDKEMADLCTIALGVDDAGYPVVTSPDGKAAARQRCADAINAARAGSGLKP